MSVTFELNGRNVSLDVDPDMPLLWAIRESAGLTGTKFGCGAALCGACTVHVDGEPTRSCSVPVGAVAGQRVTTVEGLETGGNKAAKAVQAAWQALDVVQCGYCQSGQIMSATALLSAKPRPTDADIDEAMSGNLCRCATYVRIRAAIHDAARRMEA
ncbi:(2Fe-2S)-binding protein [Azospirillum sp. RWY-5-1]|uniref:(2Fe-2S)-binding protein n=1 Tax=Azospirillum oleiclasticum TaxID=2735135 RepID=A0ABX2TBF1_9PROT|nr:(2Fe-2S)-binding protein [Azospirillum oleiclasticum]NYZ12968.1 (2Fe-2S)-binding protein [Azospirillum oleiclasticum]NYZ20359.1 (2Fe-2S)-binding protein [Azospirillum oleiclasticum]